MPAQKSSEWIGLTITIVIVGLIILGTLRISKRLEGPKPKPKRPTEKTPLWFWVFLIMLTALVAFAVSAGKPGQPPSPWIVIGLPIVSTVGFVAILYAVAFFKNYDRDASRAIKLAKSGAIDDAIGLLKEAMEQRKPSAIRSNTMGYLHTMREDWPEAYKSFLEAEAIGGRRADFVGNQGVALWKMSRLEEAEAVVREAIALEPTNPLLACNLGAILADLGRIEEASQQLEIAEVGYKKLVTIPPSAKKPIGEEIAKLWARLATEKGPATDEIAGP